jgi:tRNA modification GTPase
MTAVDAIAALATAPGRGAIGIVRVSGPRLAGILPPLLGLESLTPRTATLAPFLDAEGETLDRGLALFFPAPHSYTGEDVLELHGHGGTAVLASVLRRVLELGARMAEPGEFTRRAYLNGRLDLLQAEAVADLIAAGTEAAARAAVRSLDGEFSDQIGLLATRLTELRTLVEACIDFPEEDVELLAERGGLDRLGQVRAQLEAVRKAASAGRLLREGAKVVLCGQPNVGKSTLLNRLAGADAAIVSEVPGTTRDTLREAIQIDGIPVQIFDTAGLRETSDIVEGLGVARTWTSLQDADIAVLVFDIRTGVTPADRSILDRLPPALPRVLLANKADLMPDAPVPAGALLVSALEGWGLDRLRARILELIGWDGTEAGVYAARERHLQALSAATRALESAAGHVRELELFAEDLRAAQEALAPVNGSITSDELLGQIFATFCIGK